MRPRLLLLLATMALVAAACSSSEESTTTSTASTTSPSTTATTTTADPGTTTTATTAPATESSGPLDLASYLAASYRLDGAFTAQINASLSVPPDEWLPAQVAIYEEYVAALRSLEPPAEAAGHHAAVLALMERALATTRRAQDAEQFGSTVEALEALNELVDLGTEMVSAGFELAAQQRALVEELLAERDDAQSRYILDLLSLQTSDSARTLETLLVQTTTTPDLTLEEFGQLYQDIAAFFAATLAEYQAVTPPDSWADLYRAQVELLEDGIELYSTIGDVLVTGEEPDIALLFELLDFAARGTALTEAVSNRLADHFEGRPTLQIIGSLVTMPLDPAEDDPAIGEPAPVVSGADFDGNAVAIEGDGRAKAIVFLAHWCPHCQAEVPRVQAWLDATGGVEGVDLHSVATSIDPRRGNYPPAEWLEREGWTVPVIEDDSVGSVHAAFGNGAFPFWVFTNADGTVALRVEGEITIEELEAILAGLG